MLNWFLKTAWVTGLSVKVGKALRSIVDAGFWRLWWFFISENYDAQGGDNTDQEPFAAGAGDEFAQTSQTKTEPGAEEVKQQAVDANVVGSYHQLYEDNNVEVTLEIPGGHGAIDLEGAKENNSETVTRQTDESSNSRNEDQENRKEGSEELLGSTPGETIR